MKHYVIVNEWACNCENASSVIGVAHSMEEATKIFNEFVVKERLLADECGYKVYNDTEDVFDAGEDGSYFDSHTKTYIQSV